MVSDSSDGIDWRNGIATKLGVVIALVIAVIAIGWGWNYGLVQERTYEQEARQAHADQSENGCYQIAKTQVQSTSVKKLDSKPCTPDEKAHQENDNRRDYADLVAQRSSALWAKIMGIAALIGMGLSLVGVALVWTTFRETRNANDIAKGSQRPWLSVTIRPKAIKSSDTHIAIEYDAVIKNLGQSIAHVRVFEVKGRFVEKTRESFKAEQIEFREKALQKTKRPEEGDQTVLPNEEIYDTNATNQFRRLLPWTGEGDGKLALFVISVCVLYIDGKSDELMETTRHFTIGKSGETFTDRFIANRHFIGNVELTATEIAVHPTGANETS